MAVTLKNQIGAIKTAPTGFSWTSLFFGCFVPLLRGDGKWFIISLVAGFVTVGISWLFFPFFYNKVYLNSLLEKGYGPADDQSKNILISKGLLAKESV